MKLFVTYLKDYFRNSSLKSLVFILVFVAALIFLNYTIGIEKRIRDIRPWPLSLMSFFFFYSFVLFFSWAVQYTFGKYSSLSENHPDTSFSLSNKKKLFLLLLLAPLYFSFKMIHWDFSLFTPAGWRYPWNQYTLIVLQLPAKLLLLFLLLYFCWKMEGNGKSGRMGIGNKGPGVVLPAEVLSHPGNQGFLPFFGLTLKNFSGKPYFLILLFLVPLIALASTRPDFLHTYPKVKNISFINGYTHPAWPWQILYEISYGLDFLSIELFFRGFLVIGLTRYAGEYAILPMAAFYCTIHFGKPLGECISSFFGGLALGVIALRTRSIFGGLIIHLGLAWLMELGGWLGSFCF